MGKKPTYEYIKKFFKDNNCELLEETYKNSGIPMKYICECAGISKITFRHLKNGGRCRKCGNNKRRHTLGYVKQYFEDNGCELIEDKYINNVTPMKYKCSCGNLDKITLGNFQKGQKCHKCAIKRRSGPNNCNYNPNLTDEERKLNKSRYSDHFYIQWRKKVFKRDKYLCQKCNCNKKKNQLNAHPIESWGFNKDLRLVISNGITFCEDCHKEFHKEYGYGNNDRRQVKEYLGIINLIDY